MINTNSYELFCTADKPKTSNDYSTLIEHLSENDKKVLENRISKVTEKDIQNFLEILKDPHKNDFDWSEELLEEYSATTLAGLKKGLCSLKQAASFHMLSAAVDELYINLKIMAGYWYEDPNLKKDQMAFVVSDFPGGFGKEHYNNQYQSQASYIQQTFQLDEGEWRQFCDLMEKEEPSEQFYHFIMIPQYGCWSILYERLRDLITIFPTLKRNSYFWSESLLAIPSFSMLQNFFHIKADNRSRPRIDLCPRFGELSYCDIDKIKRSQGCQLGLYIPGTCRDYFQNIDSWLNCGPLSHWMHDAYHALRELEMTYEYSEARHRLIDILPKSEHSLINGLIDGELLHAYPKEYSVFKIHGIKILDKSNEKFGAIFKTLSLEQYWTDFSKQIVLKDMVKNSDIWDRWKIDESHLSRKERQAYNKLKKRNLDVDNASKRVVKRRLGKC